MAPPWPSPGPGKPTDHTFIEAFRGHFRAECLNAHWFQTLADAAEKSQAWRRDYNGVRPQGAIGNKPPSALVDPGDTTSLSPLLGPGNSSSGCSRERGRIESPNVSR
jgi:putative transposase